MSPSESPSRDLPDILTADEEAALALVRTAVDEARSAGGPDEFGRVHAGLLRAGAVPATGDGEPAANRGYRLGRARFVLGSVPQGIRLEFPGVALLALALAGALRGDPAGGATAWSFVPASPAERATGILSVPRPLDERVVRVTGREPGPLPALPPPAPTVRAALPEIAAAVTGTDPDSVAGDGAVLWPDASGTIRPAPPQGPGGTVPLAAPRNPWDIRASARPASEPEVLVCGGVLIGEGAPAVAMVNGRILRAGDLVGRFRVARIGPNGVVVENGGSLYGLPRGRRTLIALSPD